MPKSIRSDGLLALGRAVAEIRLARGMSQRQFAASIGCRGTFLEKVEMDALAQAMKVEAGDLLRRVEEATPATQSL